MHTIRLVYASVARPGLDYAELTGILRGAGRHNTDQSITGILIYGNGMFLQVLEGERRAVNVLYNRIVQDARHSECTLLTTEAISERCFADWSMKLVGIDGMATAARRSLLLRFSGQQEFDPFHMTAPQALGFLCALADTERLAAA